MPETVICAPVRTAVGRYGGVFKDMQGASLGAAVISAVVKRTVVDPGLIDTRAILIALGRDDSEIGRLILDGVVSEPASTEG